ncbi:26S proteasome regulatory complex, subunit RPN5/PSMD12 [Pseudoloma neurophilia]|uniref:26S proteasome regulatory complex, subunit RPN5/PSMD12 n=1 Tax=Pseudoloma neurophilia TaxID=146866 RepID=A0A0R0LZU6_9MICR|nr:26S proteasome regulatory complex, subunit RPN5/PSMD12 [Pseudoloma neurophilia]
MEEEKLFEEERTNRLEGNHEAQMKVFSSLLENCKDAESTLLLIKLLAKKKNQIKLTVRWLFQTIKKNYELKSYPKEFPKENVAFFTTILKELIEGKLFLEQERIDYAQYLKNIYEHYNFYTEALQITYDVPIETFSTIKLEDILKYQLDTLRLAIICQDTAKAEILSKKTKEKHLTDKKLLWLLRTDYFTLSGNYLKATKEIMKIVEDSTVLNTTSHHSINQAVKSNLNIKTQENSDVNTFKFKHFFEIYSQQNLNQVLVQQASLNAILAKNSEINVQDENLIAIHDKSELRSRKECLKKERVNWLKKLKMNVHNVEKMRDMIDLFLRPDIISKDKCVKQILAIIQEHRIIENTENILKLIGTAINLHNLEILQSCFKSISFSDLESLLQSPIELLLELITNIGSEFCKIDQRGQFLHFNHQQEIDETETLKVLDETVMFCTKEKLRRKIEKERNEQLSE